MELAGKELPVNYIDFDALSGVGEIGYEVADEDDPVQLLDGSNVRVITVKYLYEEVIYASEYRQ